LVIDKKNIIATLYVFKNNKWEIVKEFNPIKERTEIKLQPAKYKLVYINKDTKYSDRTKIRNFDITEKKTVLIN